MEILTDDKPQEMSFTLTAVTTNPKSGQQTRTPIATEQTFGANVQESFEYHDLDPDAKFELVVQDAGGDGICCSHGSGEILVREVDNHNPDMIVTDLVTSTNGDYGAEWKPVPFYLPSFNPTWLTESQEPAA